MNMDFNKYFYEIAINFGFSCKRAKFLLLIEFYI